MDELTELLSELSDAYGVPGREGAVAAIIERRLRDIADIEYDALGSIICSKKGTADRPRIMLAAHMDEIGFMVSAITEEGFLRFEPLGGWWEQVMLSQRVNVITSKGQVPGVIGSKPPHILEREERKKSVQKNDMFVDVGAENREEAMSFGIRPGDAIVPLTKCSPMANPRLLMGKAWDDRVGCALLLAVMSELERVRHENAVYAVGTVQEEVGCRGAITSSNVVEPDIAIVLESAIATDTPGLKDLEPRCKIGKGPAIIIYDASMIPSVTLRDFVIEVAQQENIPIQFSSMPGGGTDAGKIHVHARGVPSLVLGVPVRYIHSHDGIISLDDFQSSVRLLVSVMERLNAVRVEKILGRRRSSRCPSGRS